MVVLDEIKGSSISKKPSSTMSVMLCTGATFVKKNSCLVARIVPFDAVGLHLLTFRILEPYPSKDIALDLSHIIQIIIVHFKSYLNQCFQISKLLKYDGNIVVKYVFSTPCCGKDFSKPSCEA